MVFSCSKMRNFCCMYCLLFFEEDLVGTKVNGVEVGEGSWKRHSSDVCRLKVGPCTIKKIPPFLLKLNGDVAATTDAVELLTMFLYSSHQLLYTEPGERKGGILLGC